jgi:membrane fusion protein, peptide pheromone/bacteriocin exporter
MENKIFPASIIKNTVEVYDSRIGVNSILIYIMLLGLILSTLFSLPWIFVDVAVQVPGTFQSSLQRNSVMNTANGRLEFWGLSENKKVNKGDLIAVIRGEQINLEMKGLSERILLLENFITDLKALLNFGFSSSSDSPQLKTGLYRASFIELQAQLQNQELAVQKSGRDFQRAKTLFESKSIAFADFDEVQIQYQQSITQLELLKKQKISQWGQELINYSNEKEQLQNQLAVSKEQLDQYKIIAGTSGTLINVQNLNVGDFVYPNQKFAEISPDSGLIAVTHLSPADIAFLEKGQEVKFQVDAYNYNQWGVATGKVVEISDDLTLLAEDKAGFLVTCKLDSNTLTLPGGQKGEIRKGMTFNARFVVANRSLFQLLYDKVDNWLNPSVAHSN